MNVSGRSGAGHSFNQTYREMPVQCPDELYTLPNRADDIMVSEQDQIQKTEGGRIVILPRILRDDGTGDLITGDVMEHLELKLLTSCSGAVRMTQSCPGYESPICRRISSMVSMRRRLALKLIMSLCVLFPRRHLHTSAAS